MGRVSYHSCSNQSFGGVPRFIDMVESPAVGRLCWSEGRLRLVSLVTSRHGNFGLPLDDDRMIGRAMCTN